MFYCEECRVKHGWPQGISKSFGPCEMCNKCVECNDVPSSALPPSKVNQDADNS